MFFTQVKCDEVAGPAVEVQSCPKCGEPRFHLQGKICYLSLELFELPILIFKRRFLLQCECGHCETPARLSASLSRLKQRMFPLHYYLFKHIGAILLMVLAIYQWQQYQTREAQAHSILSSPQVNDFYFFDYYRFNPDSHAKFRYTTMKVIAVEDSQVTLRMSTLANSRKKKPADQVKADRAMLPGFFSKKTYTLSAAKLTKLYDQGVVYEVRRPDNLKIDGWIVMAPPQPEEYIYRYNQDNQAGISMFRGEAGFARDYVGAFEAFTKAAQAGDPSGQNNLAEMYRDGLGTIQDKEKALYWFAEAANQGHVAATENHRQLCPQVADCKPL